MSSFIEKYGLDAIFDKHKLPFVSQYLYSILNDRYPIPNSNIINLNDYDKDQLCNTMVHIVMDVNYKNVSLVRNIITYLKRDRMKFDIKIFELACVKKIFDVIDIYIDVFKNNEKFKTVVIATYKELQFFHNDNLDDYSSVLTRLKKIVGSIEPVIEPVIKSNVKIANKIKI